MGWGGGLTFPLEVPVKTAPGVCLAHGPLWGDTLGTGGPGPRRAWARAAAELWGGGGEVRVPWVLAGSPPGPQGWTGSRLRSPPAPAQPVPRKPGAAAPLHCPRGPCPLPAQGLSCRGFQPRVPVSRPGRWAWRLGAPHTVPGQTLPMHPVDTSRILTTGPLSAVTINPRWLGASAGGPRVHRGPSTEASAEKGKQSGSPSSPCQRWHAGGPSGVGEGAVLCRRHPDGLQAALAPSARWTPCPSQPPESLSLSPRPA